MKKSKHMLVLTIVLMLIMSLTIGASFSYALESTGLVNQVVQAGGEQYYDAAGQLLSSSDGQEPDGWVVKTSKTIVQSPTHENRFEVQLKVTTKKDVKETVKSSPVHLVLVIDRSVSMKMDNQYNMYLDDTKAAAKEFINQLMGSEDASAENKISLVSYANSATTDCAMTEDLARLEKAVDAIVCKDNDKGTNIQDGIAQAQRILDQDKADDPDFGGKRLIVLMTDGFPTRSYKALSAVADNTIGSLQFGYDPGEKGFTGVQGGTATGLPYGFRITEFAQKNPLNPSQNLKGQQKWHSDYPSDKWQYQIGGTEFNVADHVLPTISQAQITKDAGYEIYSVLMMSENNKENNPGPQTAFNVANYTMAAVASGSDHFFASLAIDDLANVFKDVSQKIITDTKLWRVTDTIGNLIQCDGAQFTGELYTGVTYDNETKTITWDLLNSDVDYSLEGPEQDPQYVYTLQYTVTLDTLDKTFTAKSVIGTSKATVVKYFMGETFTENSVHNAGFAEAAVQGFADNLTFTKVRNDKARNALSGAVFALIANDDGNAAWSAEDGNAGGRWYMTATSAANGAVEFSQIPSGHSYLLLEIAAPANYELNEGRYPVTVSYGELTLNQQNDPAWASSNGALAFINNINPGSISITITKQWLDGGRAPLRGDIVLRLNGSTVSDEEYSSRDYTLSPTPAEGKITVVENGDEWTAVIDDLPMLSDKDGSYSQPITYTVQELSVDSRYYAIDASVHVITNGQATITNSLNNSLDIVVTKQWIAPDGVLSNPSVQVQLLKNGTPMEQEIKTITGVNGETRFENLTLFDEGQTTPNVYTVQEIFASNGADSAAVSDGTVTLGDTEFSAKVSGFSIINEYEYEELPEPTPPLTPPPATGDNTMAIILIAIIGMAAVVMLGICVGKKKRI